MRCRGLQRRADKELFGSGGVKGSKKGRGIWAVVNAAVLNLLKQTRHKLADRDGTSRSRDDQFRAVPMPAVHLMLVFEETDKHGYVLSLAPETSKQRR